MSSETRDPLCTQATALTDGQCIVLGSVESIINFLN